jgi:hypothetical protein
MVTGLAVLFEIFKRVTLDGIVVPGMNALWLVNPELEDPAPAPAPAPRPPPGAPEMEEGLLTKVPFSSARAIDPELVTIEIIEQINSSVSFDIQPPDKHMRCRYTIANRLPLIIIPY